MIDAQKTAFRTSLLKFLKWQSADLDSTIEKLIHENLDLIDDGQAMLLIAEKYKFGLSKAFTALLDEVHEILASIPENIQSQSSEENPEENWNDYWIKPILNSNKFDPFLKWVKIDDSHKKLTFRLIDENLGSHMHKVPSKKEFNKPDMNCLKVLDEKGVKSELNTTPIYIHDAMVEFFQKNGIHTDKLIELVRETFLVDSQTNFKASLRYI